MSLEQAIQNLADAINALAQNSGRDPGEFEAKINPDVFIMNLDDLGQPTKFKSRCSICKELGRNSRTCQPTPDGSGSYHWKVVQE